MTVQSLSQEDIFVLLKWLLVVAIWVWLAVSLYTDNERVKQLPHNSLPNELLTLLHRRNIYIYGLVSMILVIAISGDISHIVKIRAETAAVIAETPHELESKTPVEETPKYVVPHNSKIPFSDITEFNEENSKQQAYTDLLKQRYETWLITYNYLKKCNKVGSGDLEEILGSLRKELKSVHADTKVENNIMSAAEGSYREMYGDIPCDDAHLITTKAGYDASMQRINPPTQAQTTTPADKGKPITITPEGKGTSAPITPVSQSTMPTPETLPPSPPAR